MNLKRTNDILIILAFAGLFVAGYLAIAHSLNAHIACGFKDGCDVVASHPSSKIGSIPVPFFGLVGYLLLLGLGLLRATGSPETVKKLAVLGFIVSGAGAMFSIYLMIIAKFVIDATCIWCISSATIMILTFLLHGWLVQKASAYSPEVTQEIDPGLSVNGIPKPLLFVLTCALVGGLAGGTMQLKRGGGRTETPVEKLQQMGPEDFTLGASFLVGDANAPITLIEVADFLCDNCRQAYPTVEKLIISGGKNIRYGYTSFPIYTLKGHEMSSTATVIAQYAASKGKLFRLIPILFHAQKSDLMDFDSLIKLSVSAGLDEKALRTELQSNSHKYTEPTAKLMEKLKNMGIDRTPMFLIFYGNKAAAVLSYDALQKFIEDPEFLRKLTR